MGDPSGALLGLFGLLERLERSVPEGLGELAVSILIVTVVLLVHRLVRRYQASLDGAQGLSRRWVLSSTIIAATTALGVFSLVGVWGLLTPLADAYSSLELYAIGGKVVLAALLLAGAYVSIGYLGRVIRETMATGNRVSEHQREVIYRVTQVTVYSVVGLLVVALFTENLSSLILGAGFLGIVVGMAARQTLGAGLAGFVLMFSRPFEIGDWVEIDDEEGIVTHISLVNTQLQTFDGEYVMLPNNHVTGSPITNRTRKGRLRIEVDVGVDYDADPDRAADVAVDAVSDLDEVRNVPTPQVVMKGFGDSAVLLGVRCWIDNPSARRMWRARTAVISAVKSAYDEADIKIPFPQRELVARPEAGGFALADDRSDVRARPTADGGRESDGGGS